MAIKYCTLVKYYKGKKGSMFSLLLKLFKKLFKTIKCHKIVFIEATYLNTSNKTINIVQGENEKKIT